MHPDEITTAQEQHEIHDSFIVDIEECESARGLLAIISDIIDAYSEKDLTIEQFHHLTLTHCGKTDRLYQEQKKRQIKADLKTFFVIWLTITIIIIISFFI